MHKDTPRRLRYASGYTELNMLVEASAELEAITDTTDANGNGVPDFSDADLVAPTIVTQPRSLNVTAGQSASFTVVASGVTSYQWLKHGNAISRATAPQLDLSNVQPSDAATYTVRVTNAVGSVVSRNATLTVPDIGKVVVAR